jgi:hypothetical protein
MCGAGKERDGCAFAFYLASYHNRRLPTDKKPVARIRLRSRSEARWRACVKSQTHAVQLSCNRFAPFPKVTVGTKVRPVVESQEGIHETFVPQLTLSSDTFLDWKLSLKNSVRPGNDAHDGLRGLCDASADDNEVNDLRNVSSL